MSNKRSRVHSKRSKAEVMIQRGSSATDQMNPHVPAKEREKAARQFKKTGAILRGRQTTDKNN